MKPEKIVSIPCEYTDGLTPQTNEYADNHKEE